MHCASITVGVGWRGMCVGTVKSAWGVDPHVQKEGVQDVVWRNDCTRDSYV